MDADKRRQLRDAFGAFMTGVTVVTTTGDQGRPLGFTANSFSSVSLDPPLLLVSIDKRSANFAQFTGCGHFAINVLSEQQKETSNIFAQKIEDRFALIDWHPAASGAPLIDGSSAWFDCRLHQVVDAGDHAILIGEVGAFGSSGTAGLGYYRGAYFTPFHNAESLITNPEVVVSALIEFNGRVAMVKQQEGGYALPARTVGDQSVSDTLAALTGSLSLNASPGFVYSIYDERPKKRQHIVFLCALPTDDAEALPPLHQAEWYPLSNLAGLPVADSALKSLMNRFVREHAVGNYAIYYGDEQRGCLKHFAG